MKRRPQRAWPKEIVEVPTSRPDPRSDPQATQKISREQLEEALERTKSGMRRATRTEPEPFLEDLAGPRDDAPEVTIVAIDSVEFEPVDPLSLPPITSSTPAVLEPRPLPVAVAPRPQQVVRGLAITPRTAFLAGVVVAIFVALAAFVGFYAGGGFPHPPK